MVGVLTLLIFLMGKGEKPLKLQCRSKHARWLEVRRGARPGPEMQKVWLTKTTITLVILTLMHYWFPTIIFPQTSEKTPPEQSFCTFVCACVSTCALEGRVKTSTTMICFLIRQLERTKQNLIHANTCAVAEIIPNRTETQMKPGMWQFKCVSVLKCQVVMKLHIHIIIPNNVEWELAWQEFWS